MINDHPPLLADIAISDLSQNRLDRGPFAQVGGAVYPGDSGLSFATKGVSILGRFLSVPTSPIDWNQQSFHRAEAGSFGVALVALLEFVRCTVLPHHYR